MDIPTSVSLLIADHKVVPRHFALIEKTCVKLVIAITSVVVAVVLLSNSAS